IEHYEDDIDDDRLIRMYYWGKEMKKAFPKALTLFLPDYDDGEMNYMRELIFNKKEDFKD
ncbi:MAG: hypothetical protein ACOCUI_02275, partial [bacterium]